jgi:NADPH-dependent curcumin reductase CurA
VNIRETNRRVILKRQPQGIPDAEHIEIVETPIPVWMKGHVLLRNIYCSLDPAMRGWVSAETNYNDPVPNLRKWLFFPADPSITHEEY